MSAAEPKVVSTSFPNVNAMTGDGRWVTLDVGFSYSSKDPYVVIMAIVAPGELTPVIWDISRDLFMSGIRGDKPNPYADVQFSADPRGLLKLRLCPPAGTMDLFFDAEGIVEFINETFRVVPAGEEDVSDQIEEIEKFLYQWPDM